MFKGPGIVILSLLATTGVAKASCTSYPTNLTNGSTTDATQVMGNFTYLSGCAAPLASPAFTGTSSFTGTLTETGSGVTTQLLSVTASLSPAANSGANFRSFIMSNTFNAAHNFTASGTDAPTAGWFEDRVQVAGTVAEMAASEFWGLWAGGDATSLGTVSYIQGAKITPVVSFSNSLTSTITAAVGLHVKDSLKGTFVFTGQSGIAIDPLSAATNNTALLMGQTTIPTGAFGIYNASTSNNYFAGKIGIGTSSPDQLLSVNGNADKASGGTAWAVFSDQRLKDVEGPYTRGLSDITKLEPVRFHYKKGNSLGLPSNNEEYGIIAQQAKLAFPETVSEGKSGYLEFNISPIQFAMINAFKELQGKYEKLAAENRTLKAQLLAQKALNRATASRFTRLENRIAFIAQKSVRDRMAKN